MTTDKPVEPTLTAARVRELAEYVGETAAIPADYEAAAGLRACAAILEGMEAAPESPAQVLECIGVACRDKPGREQPMLRDAIRRRDEAHEAEKQALRAERDEARQLADGYRRQFDSAEECARNHDVRATAARADADALRALLGEAREALFGVAGESRSATRWAGNALMRAIDAALGGMAAATGGEHG